MKGAAIASTANIEKAEEAERAIRLYGGMLHALAFNWCGSKENAEDVCQEVLIALLNRKQRFKNNEHMKAWLIRATIDRSKNVHRYESRHPRTSYDPALHDETEQSESADYERLHTAVESLSPELKETLRLYYRDGYSTKEIASLKGIEESSIRARLHRARKKIATVLACVITAFAVIFASASLPMQQIPEALAIDFARDSNVSLDSLPIKAVQKTNSGKAIVTFETSLSWSIVDAERVTYSIDDENVKLYSPGIGNFYTLNGGKLGSTKDAVQVSGNEASIILNIEVSINSDNSETNEDLYDRAREELRGKALKATAFLEDGNSETAECFFAK